MQSKVMTRFLSLTVTSLIGAAVANSAPADTTSPTQASPNNGVVVTVDRSAPEPGLLTDRIVASAGGFIMATDLKATLNGQSTKDPQVNFNESLGTGGDFTRTRADLLWRINPKHHVRFMYFKNDVTRTRTIDAPLEWGDYTFQANATVNTHNSTKVYELAYEYAFMRRPTYEVAASAGLHVVDMSIQLSGNATFTDSNGNVTPASFSTSQSHLPAPLPVIGLRANWAIAPQWYLDAQVQIFKFNYEGFNGTWSDLRAGATWMFSRHIGVGIAYNRFHVNVDVNRANFNGNLTLGYSGAQAFLTGSF